ncbi:OmpP1/FadL family transporter [Halpernia sp.]|uniref:OmpP1/FadL family transporter n=1 Tax=Halpernia sp. TaxID=2782209 RepID=UPI003A8E2854
MIKNSLAILTIAVSFSLMSAQDISTIRNTVDVYSNNFSNGTAKYQGMAGSMGALGGEISSLNSNPAGIGVFIASDINGTLNINNSKNTTNFNGKSLNYKINNTDLGEIGGVATFQIEGNTPWKFINIAVDYSTQSLEDYSETAGNKNISFSIPSAATTLDFDGHAYNRYGNLSNSSFAVGANYNNNLYLGAALHFKTANIDQYDTAAFTDSALNTTEIFNKQYTPFSEQSNGFAASLGVIGKLNNQIRLGASLETPTWWQITRIYNSYDNPTDDTYTEDRKLSSPMKATVSAAFVASKDFAINVDYTLGITKPKYKVYGGAETELNNFFSNSYKNLSEIKMGAEYRLMGLRLRAGYGLANSPFDSQSITAYRNDGSVGNSSFSNLILGKRTTIAGGIGYDFGSIYLDASYQNVQSTYNNPFLRGDNAVNSNYFSDNFVLPSSNYAVNEVKNNQNNISLTLGYKF